MSAIIENRPGAQPAGTAPADRIDTAEPSSRAAATPGRRTWLMATMATAAGLLAAGTNPARAAATQPRPFQSLVSGRILDTATPLTFQLAGSGVASRLGASQHAGPVVINSMDPATGVITDTLTETFTALNGDTLTLLCQQIATPVAPGSPQLQAVDQWVAIGGTGRFAGVTGSGTGSTFVDLAARTYVKQCIGSISY